MTTKKKPAPKWNPKLPKLSEMLGVDPKTPMDQLPKGEAPPPVRRRSILVNSKIPHRDGEGIAVDSTTCCDYLQTYVSFDRGRLLDDIDAVRAGIVAEGMDQTVFAPGGVIMVLRRRQS